MTVSVIMPVYNVAPYLDTALRCLSASAAACPRAPLELVCIEDGSTDASAAILEDFRARPEAAVFSAFHVLRQANSGVSAARNAGLRIAHGDWIGFMDGDDAVAPGWLAAACSLVDSAPDADLVRMNGAPVFHDQAGLDTLNAQSLELRRRGLEGTPKSIRHYRGKAACRWALSRYARDGWCWANWIRRGSLGDLRFPEGMRLKEDVVFFMQAACRIGCATEGRYPGYWYRSRRGSAVHQSASDGDCLRFIDEMLKLADVEKPVVGTARLRRAVGRSLGYDFVHFAIRDRTGGSDPGHCPVRARWKRGIDEGRIDLRGIAWWWRPAVRRWLATGDLTWAAQTRRLLTFWR